MKNLLLSVVLVSVSLSANALTFTEATDFPNGASFGVGSLSVGTLTLGANTVSGGLNGSCVVGDCNASPGGSSGDSQDSFVFTVAAGTSLSSLVVTTAGVSGPSGFSASIQILNPSFVLVTNANPIAINSAGGNILSSALGAGVYSLSTYGQTASAAGAYVLPYSLAFTVVGVPEPAALAMLLLGLTVVLGLRNRAGRAAGG